MSSIRCIDFYDLCRICTASSEQKTNVFSAEGRTKNLTMKIAECLSLNVDEKDRLPKVICAQCVQYVDHMFEFRNICNNSQAMLNSCLDTATTQNGGKVYIKDAISGTGKSLSVLGGNGILPTVTPAPSATLTLQTPIQAAPTSIQNTLQSSDLLTTIMQAVGGLKPGVNQQYTITVDNKSAHSNAPVEYKIEAVPLSNTVSSDSNILKSEKQSVLEEFIKLKPDIKITPLSKKQPPKPPQHTAQQQPTVSHIQIQQSLPEQQHQQQTALQIQLPQQIQQLQQQLQQQQLQQQIQQLTSQWQAQQQLTITAPTTLTSTSTSSTQQLRNNTPLTSTTAEELSPSKSKKPKFNFVLTSPQSQTFTATLPQPQIKLELQPSSTTAQQQTSQPLNAAALLSNLATPQTSGGNVLSPNKCYLPITIRDENSDQQIVAHIDAKNFVFPTTYQVQMKLQRELATADGQPIMQFSPTSIPATLQLNPQAINNPTFQTDIQSQLHPFIIEKPPQQQQHQLQQYQQPQQEQRPPQQQQQHQPQPQQQQPQIQQQQHQPQVQQQPQPQQSQQHQPQQQQPLQQKRQSTAEVTSHQIIRTSNYPQPVANIIQVSSANKVAYQGNPSKAEENKQFKTTVQKPEKLKGVKQEKYKLLQQRSPNVFEIMPTTNFTQQIMEQVKQQQLQKQQAKQQEMNTQAETKQVISTPQHPGLTVQRVQTKAPIAATKSPQAATTSIVGSGSTPPKLPVLNKQNITISRITSQNTQQKQQQQQQNVAQKQTTTVKIVQQQQKPKVSAPVSQQQQQPQRQQQQQQNQQYIQTPKSTNSVTQQVPPAAAKVQEQSPSTKKVADKSMPAKLEATTSATSAATNNTNATTPAKTESSPSEAQENAAQNESPTATSSAASNQHTCQTCGRGFKKKEHLTQHAKLHAGLRPFKCTEENCNKAFSRKEHLMRHCVSHTGQKMFSCDICFKPFSRKDNLNKHRRVHNSQTTELIYKCGICQKSFAVKAYYDKHKEMHKKTETKTAAGTAIKQSEKTTQSQPKPAATSTKTESSTPKQQTQRLHILQTSTTTSQTAQSTSQQQIMHVQLQPQVVTTQDLAGNTITITQASDSNMPTSLANFMQLGYSQFQNSTPGQIVCTIEK